MTRPVPRHKSVYILPNLFTTASLFAGFLGLLWASAGRYEACALAILFSALMDGLDGKVARLTGTASEFGVQYDSLADLVAFGVTPAFLLFEFALNSYERLGMAACFLFTVCGALRLARFNVQASTANKRFFTGLPIPAGGCTLACLVLIAPKMPPMMQQGLSGICLFVTVSIAFLMVSQVRYASFKELGFMKAHPFRTMVIVIALFAVIAANPKLFGSLGLFGYIISGLIYTFVTLPRLSKLANRAAQHQERQAEQKDVGHKEQNSENH
ncbi:CDP-diacylglycerol--serine O-phosphatidyltransferase [Desulfovibrio sp. OttesenSCG-928-F20]|nr:CDP-diacylglycerol--serine O-phosphatidyltransferase [Desulfovibrio sp. OttesenSCG-928-M16]MDL2291046.1 CDP-diacylglycerol--serine O-phosphatidyltransferase [Desulfovibrio sp. OttesenSCG-928-F20]